MEYTDIFEIEFIERTKEIINQYTGPFENTLFVNACVGLIIFPEQRLYDNLPKDIVSGKDWGISPNDIKVENNKDVRTIARHIRNAISHGGVQFASDNGKDITHIQITDYNHTETTFQAKINIEKFKKFVLAIAQFALDNKRLFSSTTQRRV